MIEIGSYVRFGRDRERIGRVVEVGENISEVFAFDKNVLVACFTAYIDEIPVEKAALLILER